MAKILKPVLRVLESLYRFPGGQDGAPTEVELGLGVTPVHDVSKMVERANAVINRASGGYWGVSEVQSHAAPGTISANLNLANPTNAAEGYLYDEASQWIWIINVWMSVSDVSDFNSAQVALRPWGNDFFIGPHDSQPPSAQPQVIGRWVSAATETGFDNIGIPQSPPIALFPLVVLSPQDGLVFQSNTDVAGTTTITFNVLIWVGARNTYPPGLS